MNANTNANSNRPMILHPGEYFIELEFDRPVDPAVLHRALTGMGFGVVVFDQSIPSVEIGSFAATRTTSATSAFKAAIAPVIAPIQSRYAAPAVAPIVAVVAPKPVVAPVAVVAAPKPVMAPIVAVVATPKPVVPTASPTSPVVRLADGGSPTALKSSTVSAALSTFAKPATSFASPVATKPAPAPTPTVASPTAPVATPSATPSAASYDTPREPSGTGPEFPGDVPPAPPAAPSTEPKADFVAPAPVYDQVEEPAQEESSYAYSSPSPSPSLSPTPPSYETQASAPSPSPLAPSPSRAASEPERDPKKLTELWTRWKEWGSPFASGPNVAGIGGGDDDLLRFRVLARLDRPIALEDRAGMRWLFVKALSIPFLSDLVFQAHPHTLRQGSLYELRFLSRAKSNRTRDSVKQELTDMGWRPVKLSAIKRNMTLPRRPASLTLWYGMAVWNHADSVIVNDDPFFFETVKDIRPR